jgi:hypothetical protein
VVAAADVALVAEETAEEAEDEPELIPSGMMSAKEKEKKHLPARYIYNAFLGRLTQ